jgi:hypothetical protein
MKEVDERDEKLLAVWTAHTFLEILSQKLYCRQAVLQYHLSTRCCRKERESKLFQLQEN